MKWVPGDKAGEEAGGSAAQMGWWRRRKTRRSMRRSFIFIVCCKKTWRWRYVEPKADRERLESVCVLWIVKALEVNVNWVFCFVLDLQGFNCFLVFQKACSFFVTFWIFFWDLSLSQCLSLFFLDFFLIWDLSL